jgi:starch synthase (maltosyl-transferring)
MWRNAERRFATRYPNELRIEVDRPRAAYSAWYELFPRSAASEEGKHGTFRDVEAQLPRIARMGFDILYLPPIHPIGTTFRKGKNNRCRPEAGRRRQPVGDRRRGGRAQSGASAARHDR